MGSAQANPNHFQISFPIFNIRWVPALFSNCAGSHWHCTVRSAQLNSPDCFVHSDIPAASVDTPRRPQGEHSILTAGPVDFSFEGVGRRKLTFFHFFSPASRAIRSPT